MEIKKAHLALILLFIVFELLYYAIFASTGGFSLFFDYPSSFLLEVIILNIMVATSIFGSGFLLYSIIKKEGIAFELIYFVLSLILAFVPFYAPLGAALFFVIRIYPSKVVKPKPKENLIKSKYWLKAILSGLALTVYKYFGLFLAVVFYVVMSNLIQRAWLKEITRWWE